MQKNSQMNRFTGQFWEGPECRLLCPVELGCVTSWSVDVFIDLDTPRIPYHWDFVEVSSHTDQYALLLQLLSPLEDRGRAKNSKPSHHDLVFLVTAP